MLEPGAPIGPYQVQSLLGLGGMGEVYRARDPRLARTVALKILPSHVAADPGRRQRFEQEARAASALNHPNILSVYDTGEYEGLVYMVSELIEGESLRESIRRGPLPVSKVVDISSQIAAGLAAAHAAGIIHRDLKPENIMVTRDGRAKILDFGLAKQATAIGVATDAANTVTHTSPGAVMGTAAYMSPEQIRGETVDHRSDIFSLGLVIYECITGRQPFERNTSVEVMTAILREDPTELPESTPSSLRQIALHCMEKDPEHRFHSARDLGFALRNAATGSRPSGQISQPPPTPEPAPSSSASRRPWFWPAVSAVLALMLLGAAIPHFSELQPIDLSQYHITPFATEEEQETDAAWSPDGKSIAYLKTMNGIPQLMVRAVDASSPVQLTTSQSPVRHTFWAPDSNLLYFVLQATRGELWAISPAGGQPRRILERVISGAISPDGKTLAIWRATVDGTNVRGSVWLSSPPGAEPRPYKPAPFQTPELSPDNRLAFSPDGASIFLVTGSSAANAWLLPFPDGGAAPHRLFEKTDLGVSPKATWMPDSRHIILAFAPSLAEGTNLWMGDLRAERMRQLTAGTLDHDQPSASPDGHRVVFTTIKDDYNVVQLPLTGGPPQTLLANSRNEVSPAWSPQGNQIAYSTDRTGNREIWIHNFTASIDRAAVTAKDFPKGNTTGLVSPIFSPDGARLAFVRYSNEGPATIWVAPAVGGAPVRLTREYMQAPVWSPDGSSVAGLMQRDNPGQPAIVGVGADMTARLIPNAPGCRTPLDWSGATNWLVCEGRDGVVLFTPDGTQQRKLPSLAATTLVFSRDGRTLYAVGKEQGRTFLKSMDVTSGAIHPLADYGTELTLSGGLPFHARLSVNPDGKSLATSAVVLKSDLWLLEGYPVPRPWWQFWR